MRLLTKILLATILIAGTGHSIAKPIPTVIVKTSEIVDRHLSGFNAINVSGLFDVDITQGNAESVKVEAPSGVMYHIITEVNNGVLKIYDKYYMFKWGPFWGFRKKILVHVTLKDVNSITISGLGDVWFREGITATNLKLRISGSGGVTGKLTVKTLEAIITGSGDMRLSGNAQNSTVTLVSSGDFIARNLLTISSAVRVSGSGDAEINASDRVDASIRGSGDIRYTGTAKIVNSSKSGSGEINRF